MDYFKRNLQNILRKITFSMALIILGILLAIILAVLEKYYLLIVSGLGIGVGIILTINLWRGYYQMSWYQDLYDYITLDHKTSVEELCDWTSKNPDEIEKGIDYLKSHNLIEK